MLSLSQDICEVFSSSFRNPLIEYSPGHGFHSVSQPLLDPFSGGMPYPFIAEESFLCE